MDLPQTSSRVREAAVDPSRSSRLRRPRTALAPVGHAPTDSSSRSLTARGPRGELRFSLKCSEGGLYVEREEIPSRGLHCVQSMHFGNVQQFEQWCDGDPVRFEHPMLLLMLKRNASALWRLGDGQHP